MNGLTFYASMNEPEGETDMINPDVGNPITNKVGTAYFETFNGKPCLTLEPHSYFWDENANYWTWKSYTPDMTFSCFVATRGNSILPQNDSAGNSQNMSPFLGLGKNTSYSTGNGVILTKKGNYNGNAQVFNLEYCGHYETVLAGPNAPDDKWYLLTVSIKNGTARCYTNGVYKGGGNRTYKQINHNHLGIGMMSDPAGPDGIFESVLKFSITEIKIWNRVLSDEEIQMLYNNYNNN